MPKKTLPRILRETVLGSTLDGHTRVALFIEPPKYSPKTVIAQFRKEGYDVRRMEFGVDRWGGIAATTVVVVIHDG